MGDYFEIEFLDVESNKSGDAITVRYELQGSTYIHVVDAGFQATGDSVVAHVRKYYGAQAKINHAVASHPDGDHAGGLRAVLENMAVERLWMLRPWLYADELLPRFSRFKSAENLKKRLKEVYPNLAALEEIALAQKIPISEPFQGAKIGAFTVMAPTKTRYLELIVTSERTPEVVKEAEAAGFDAARYVGELIARAVAFVKAAWGAETFSTEETSAENEMSVIQYAQLCGKKVLLTADAGRGALKEALSYAPSIGLQLPGIDRFQIPHHGSRRNVSTELLDAWLGPRLAAKPAKGSELFIAIVSSAKKDEDHPRKAVVRALIHRGAKVLATEGESVRTGVNTTKREGWGPAVPMEYPDEQEG